MLAEAIIALILISLEPQRTHNIYCNSMFRIYYLAFQPLDCLRDRPGKGRHIGLSRAPIAGRLVQGLAPKGLRRAHCAGT